MSNKKIEAIYPLSSLQQGVLFHSVEAPHSGVYFQQAILTLRGKLNVASMQWAWQRVVERHPALRTVFVWEHQERPLQAVIAGALAPWQDLDWRTLPADHKNMRLEEFLAADRKKGFDLLQGPLMRIALIRWEDDLWDLVWSCHHLLLDGWSLRLVFDEVFNCYEASEQSRDLVLPPVRPYRDYISWLQKQDLNSASNFWRNLLQGLPAPTQLGSAALPSRTTEPQFSTEEIRIEEELTAALHSMARSHKLTLNAVIQGAWAMLLGCYGSSEAVYGMVVSGRPPALAGVESIVGLLINTLPMRLPLPPADTVLSLLRRIQGLQAEISRFEYSPLVEVQSWAAVPRTQQLFDSIYVYESSNPLVSGEQNIGDLKAEAFRSVEQTNYPLTLVVGPDRRLLLRITFDCARFDAATIRNMLGHLGTLLEKVLHNPSASIGSIDLLSDRERSQLAVECNTARTHYEGKCVHELVEEQCLRTPDSLAVVCGEKRITYQELAIQSSLVASRLREHGIGPESRVAILVDRSVELIVGLLGVLKAGAAYVPLDPAYPDQRIAFILKDCGAQILLEDCRSASRNLPVCHRINLETGLPQGSPFARELHLELPLEHAAYVIYTSGSTGRPKGVVVTHRGLANYLVNWVLAAYPVTAGRGAAVSSSIAFDLSVTGIFAPLLAGREVWLVAEGAETEGLASMLRDVGAFSFVKLTPAHMDLLGQQLTAAEAARSSSALVVGGEPLGGQTVSLWSKSAPQTVIFNEYGPTEATVGCCVYRVPMSQTGVRSVPIGRPIANTALYILDPCLRPVPFGVSGELHIGGDGLARGYLGGAQITAEKFIPSPFGDQPGERIYKTGDLARYGADGNIEFLGRNDSQIKIRGFRIELGEIEAALLEHAEVKEAAAVAYLDGVSEKRIVACITTRNARPVEEAEVRTHLSARLPGYMMPSTIVWLDQLPLTTNGKIDRKALAALGQNAKLELAKKYVAPRSAAEARLASIWEEVLGVDRVGIHDSFFELGGHSLMIGQVAARVRKTFHVELLPRSFFDSPTLAEQVVAIAMKQAELTGDEEVARLLSELRPRAASSAD